MLPIEGGVEVQGRVCAVCNRGGALPCDDCGRLVCEIHAAGFKWVDAHSSSVVPNLCTVCETTRLMDDARLERSAADQSSALDVDPPLDKSPAVQMLWWARHVWPSVNKDDRGVAVELTTRDVDASVEAVNAEVVVLLGRLGWAGMTDRAVAPHLWDLVADAGVTPAGSAPVERRFFAGYTTTIGHALWPTPGRLPGAPRVGGALLSPETILWGEFSTRDSDEARPVGGFTERPGHGGLSIAILSAVARLVPDQYLS